MTSKDIRDAYESISPTQEERDRMRGFILSADKAGPGEKKLRKPMLAAVLAAVMLLLAGCAAVVMLELKDLRMGRQSFDARSWDVISLQGFEGSPGYQAAKEWRAFLESYDPDGNLQQSAYFHDFRAPDTYDGYVCYTQEMMDKVDEICKTYDLTPHGKVWEVLNVPEIFKATGIRDIRSEEKKYSFDLSLGWCYADGSFIIRGGLRTPNPTSSMIRINCTRKGSFNYSTASISSTEDYTQWAYTKDGVKLLLAADREDGFIIADREDFFITVQILDGLNMPTQEAKKKQMEALADYFDFTVQPRQPDSQILDAAQAEREEDWDQYQQRHRWDFVCRDYEAFLRYRGYLMADPEGKYALADLNSDGAEELLLSSYGQIQYVLTTENEMTALAFEEPRGEDAWLAPGNVIVRYRECGDCKEYTFFRMENGQFAQCDFLEYHQEDPGHWTRRTGNGESRLTEEEAQAILDASQPLDLSWKPIAEFPMN